jgi:hypothetical protein
MAKGRPGSEAPRQAKKHGNMIDQLGLEPELFRGNDFRLANSPFIAFDLVGEWLHIDQCWQYRRCGALTH